ncbi:hypothetical protein B0H11DRAFT_2185924 [Mycena galericulata]|nr:hypothetical protein B0H11DRAFT_2185924 [Mycena galericulata]
MDTRRSGFRASRSGSTGGHLALSSWVRESGGSAHDDGFWDEGWHSESEVRRMNQAYFDQRFDRKVTSGLGHGLGLDADVDTEGRSVSSHTSPMTATDGDPMGEDQTECGGSIPRDKGVRWRTNSDGVLFPTPSLIEARNSRRKEDRALIHETHYRTKSDDANREEHLENIHTLATIRLDASPTESFISRQKAISAGFGRGTRTRRTRNRRVRAARCTLSVTMQCGQAKFRGNIVVCASRYTPGVWLFVDAWAERRVSWCQDSRREGGLEKQRRKCSRSRFVGPQSESYDLQWDTMGLESDLDSYRELFRWEPSLGPGDRALSSWLPNSICVQYTGSESSQSLEVPGQRNADACHMRQINI